MKVGDLIEVATCSDFYGQIGIVTFVRTGSGDLEVIFSDGSFFAGPSKWFEVRNESR